ncbi:MAG: YbaK/EbsC family protein [Chloroflexi bacterium]|nr:YbaK/EbsC family protein [Chloroflexota bacterium]
MSETPVTQALDAMGIPYRFFQHAGRVNSLEQAATERNQQPEQIIRSILFRVTKGEYAMVLVAGPSQISWPALRSTLGQSRLSLAHKDAVHKITGYQIGSVSPFGLPQPMRILADARIFEPAEISIGSGIRGTTVIMETAVLKRALGDVEIVNVSSVE